MARQQVDMDQIERHKNEKGPLDKKDGGKLKKSDSLSSKGARRNALRVAGAKDEAADDGEADADGEGPGGKEQTADPASENQASGKAKPKKKKGSIWEEQQDLVSLHSDLDTEQELQYIQQQASLDDEGSDEDMMSGDDVSADGQNRVENQLIRARKQFRLVEISFPPTIIKAQGINRLRWDFVIITLAVYQAVTIPISIAFEPDDFNSPTMKTIDSMIDLVFVIDIVLNFRTSFIESVNGEEILDPYAIAYKYLTEARFYIDVLSTVPLPDLVPGNSAFLQFLGILKIVRLMRISGFIMNLNTSQETKAAFKVFYLIFTMFMYIHLVACTWYYTVGQAEVWIPNMDFIWFGCPQVYGYYYSDWSATYLHSLYTAFFLFGVGEVCPREVAELTLSILTLILSSIVNGLIIGNMALYMNELNRKNAEFQRKMDTANTAMTNLNLTQDLRREITEFFITTYGSQELQNELSDFMKKRISRTYRLLCSMYIFQFAVKTNSVTVQLFKGGSEH